MENTNERLDKLELQFDISKQSIHFLFSLLTLVLRLQEVKPERLVELLEFKNPEHKKYTEEIMKILIAEASRETIENIKEE